MQSSLQFVCLEKKNIMKGFCVTGHFYSCDAFVVSKFWPWLQTKGSFLLLKSVLLLTETKFHLFR